MTDAAELARKEIKRRLELDDKVYETLKEYPSSTSSSLKKSVNKKYKMDVTGKWVYNSLERLVKAGKAGKNTSFSKPRYKAI